MKESDRNRELPINGRPDEKLDVQALLARGRPEPPTFPSDFKPITKQISDFLSWFGARKVRISVTVGVLAGLVVALGFVVFDANRDRQILVRKYPYASSWYERSYLYACELMEKEEYAKAEPVIRKLAGKPKADFHADALLLLAECLGANANDPASARPVREAYEKFMSDYPADPRVPSAHMQLAETLAACGMFAESYEEYGKLWRMLTESEKKGEIEFLVAQNRYREANLVGAIDLLDQVRQGYPDTVVALDSALLLGRALTEIGRPEDANPILRDLVRETSGTTHAAAALLMLAENSLKAGAYKESIEFCKQWLRESPVAQHEVDVMLTLADAQLALGQSADACRVTSYIKSFFPGSAKLAKAMVLRGRSFEALGQMGDAEGTYLEAAEVGPTDPLPHELLTRIYESEGKLKDAIEQMKCACRDAPDKGDYPYQLAKLYRLNGENVNAERVLDEFTWKNQLSPFIGKAFLLLADIQIEEGRLPEAYRTLDRLLAATTTTVPDSVVLGKRADILAQIGLYDDAIEAYRLASQVGGDHRVLKRKVAQTLLAAGKSKQCLNELSPLKAANLSPDERFELAELKGRAWFNLGMFAEARSAIRGAVALRTGRENFSTLALLMQSDLALDDEREAAKVFAVTLRLIRFDEAEAPPEARHIILDWAQRLYDKGKYKQAAKVYSAIGNPQFPATDIAWALYQQGNCCYYLADFGKAREAYARLTNEFSDSEWVAFAKQKQKLINLKART